MKGKPLGEARRLRYLLFLSKLLAENRMVEMDTFINQVLIEVKDLNKILLKNKRATGIMQTPRVVRNYLSFLEWYELIKKDGRFLTIQSTASFLGSIYQDNDFKITTKERLSLFIILITNKEFQKFITSLNQINQPIDFISIDLDEHLVETYLEWCFDLGILSTSSKKWGKFLLNKEFSNLVNSNIRNDNEYEIIKDYSSTLLNTHVRVKQEYDLETIWRLTGQSIRRTSRFINSDFDPLLFSALPILLNIQIELIMKYNTIIKIQDLIDIFSEISISRNVSFSWNYLSGDGYLRLTNI